VWDKHSVFSLGRPSSKAFRRSVQALADHILDRINHASGPYQMIHSLGDGVVFKCPHKDKGKKNKELQAVYMDEVPVPYFNSRFSAMPRVQWCFGYDMQRRSLSQSLTGGTKFEIFIWFHPGKKEGCAGELAPQTESERERQRRANSKDYHNKPKRKELLRFTETLHTDWNETIYHENLADWLTYKAKAVSNGLGLSVAGGKQSVQEEAKRTEKWWPGEVDIWVYNGFGHAVSVNRARPTMAEEEAVQGDSSDVLLAPGTGQRIIAFEPEQWVARHAEEQSFQEDSTGEAGWLGTKLDHFYVDVSRGVVQNWLLLPE